MPHKDVGQAMDKAFAGPCDRLLEQRLFVSEIPVEQGLGDPCLLRNRAGGRAMVSAAGEDDDRRGQQLLTPLVGCHPLVAGRGRGLDHDGAFRGSHG